jgi:hypothetical protein
MSPIQTAALEAHDKHFNPSARWVMAGPNGLNVGDPLTKLGGLMPDDAYLVCAKRSNMREGMWVIVAAKPGPSGVEFVRWMLDAEAPQPYCFWGHYGSAADAIQAFEERT